MEEPEDGLKEGPGEGRPSAEIIAFPQRRPPQDEAVAAMRTLQDALAAQAEAVTALRRALGTLSSEMDRLHGSVSRYRDQLGRIRPQAQDGMKKAGS